MKQREDRNGIKAQLIRAAVRAFNIQTVTRSRITGTPVLVTGIWLQLASGKTFTATLARPLARRHRKSP